MQREAASAPMWCRWKATLFGLTLITSAIHFVDNAFRLDLYPGPAWLTRYVVLLSWIILLAVACLAYRVNTRTAVVAYGMLGFDGLAHYVMPHRGSLPMRCTITIGAEAIASMLLISCVLLYRQNSAD